MRTALVRLVYISVLLLLQCALTDVQTSSKISPLLAYFINFVSNGVSVYFTSLLFANFCSIVKVT